MTICFYKRTDKYFEFSNYYDSSFILNNTSIACSEVLYQAFKYFDQSNIKSMEYFNLIIQCDSPQKAKDMATLKKSRFSSNWLINKSKPYLGYIYDAMENYLDVKIVQNWDNIKENIMYIALEAKFTQNIHLKNLLINTYNLTIIENSPNDYYWGIGQDKTGQNRLGILLMTLRTQLINNPDYIRTFI